MRWYTQHNTVIYCRECALNSSSFRIRNVAGGKSVCRFRGSTIHGARKTTATKPDLSLIAYHWAPHTACIIQSQIFLLMPLICRSIRFPISWTVVLVETLPALVRYEQLMRLSSFYVDARCHCALHVTLHTPIELSFIRNCCCCQNCNFSSFHFSWANKLRNGRLQLHFFLDALTSTDRMSGNWIRKW